MVFGNPQFGQIRTSGDIYNPLFCLIDICSALGIINSRNVKSRLDKEDVHLVDTPTEGGCQQLNYITESGLYDTILRSDSPKAKPFRKWITSEVLPSIRRNGAYMTDATIESIIANPQNGIKLLMALKDERMMRRLAEEKAAYLEKMYKEQLPKAAVANAIPIDELARILRQNGVDTGKHRLYRWMRENGYLGTHGYSRNIPREQYIEMGLFVLNTGTYSAVGEMYCRTVALVTQKGIQFFVDKFIENNQK